MAQERMTSAEYRKQFGPTEAPKRKHKYGAQSTTVDGIRFDSKKEANRYAELKMLEQAGEISNLRLQVPYPIEINGTLITRYVADFVYRENGSEIVEDSKGFATDIFRFKSKLIKALYGIDIRIS